MRFRGSRLFPKYLTFIDDDLIQKMFSEMLAIYPMKICSERERKRRTRKTNEQSIVFKGNS